MLLVLQLLLKIEISHSWKPWTSLIPHLLKCVDLVF